MSEKVKSAGLAPRKAPEARADFRPPASLSPSGFGLAAVQRAAGNMAIQRVAGAGSSEGVLARTTHEPTVLGRCARFSGLQHTDGNLAAQRMYQVGLIQAKLAVSEPGDPDEQEADRVADQVMRSAEPALIGSAANTIQRKCVACEAAGTPCPACEGEEQIQRKALGGGSPRPNVRLSPLRGAGRPLAASTRAFFEPRFGMDLRSVRVHTDEAAHDAARAISARAFTLGADIAFARNQFAPETPDGKRLLAHELTHVVQQSNAGNSRRIAREKDVQAPTTQGPGSAVAATSFKQPVACYAPVGPTMTFEGVLLAANDDYLESVLFDYITQHGESKAAGFLYRLRMHVAAQVDRSELEDLDVDDPVAYVASDLERYSQDVPEVKIVIAATKVLGDIFENNRKYLAQFEAKANEVVLGMLDESENRVNQERIRYDVSWKEVEGKTEFVGVSGGGYAYKPRWTEYSMGDTPASRALAEAASGLLARKRKFDEAHKNMEEFGESVGAAIGELGRARLGGGDKDTIRLNELRDVRNHAKRDLDVFRQQKTAEFPILAAYASEEDISERSLERLQQLATGKSLPATAMIGGEIKSRLEHIRDVRKDILENNGEETKVWRVPRIIEGTRGLMGATPGTMYGRIVDDKVKDEAPGFWTNILIGLLQLVLVLLAPATGGLTLIGAAAISVGQAYAHFREYERAQMLRGTDFGAMALSSEDPSLFWLAVDIIGAGFDVGAAAGAAVSLFRALAPAARAARAARAAAKTAEEAEEAIRTLERTAGELGGETLANSVGRDARAEAMHVGETAEEARALERAGEEMAEQELRTGAQEWESIAGRKVKVSEAGGLWSCASPCTLLRERYSGLLRRKGTDWESKLKALEEEAAKIPKGEAGNTARKELAKRAAALESDMRTTAMPGEWTSPLERSLKDTDKFNELVKRRGSIAAELDHHPPNWTGADEARFRYGEKIDPEPGYRWTLDENGGLRYDRLDASLPPRQYNPATGLFEEAGEGGTLIKATKGAEAAHPLETISKKQREAMEAAFKKRGSLIAERDRLEALEEAGQKLSQSDSEKLRKIYAEINEQSRQLGENAAEAVMKGRGGKKIYPTGKPYSTSGDFDQVWKVGDEIQIIEAKGGASGLGSRQIAQGVRAEQGTVEYAKSIAQNMAKNGATKEIRQLGDELLRAIAQGKVKYVLVRAPIGEELGTAVLRDVKVSEFVLR
jgi:hypothetical protein